MNPNSNVFCDGLKEAEANFRQIEDGSGAWSELVQFLDAYNQELLVAAQGQQSYGAAQAIRSGAKSLEDLANAIKSARTHYSSSPKVQKAAEASRLALLTAALNAGCRT